MLRFFRRLLQLLITGSVSLFIAACYGVPAGYDYFYSKIITRDKDNQPIPGLSIKVTNSAAEFTGFTTDVYGTSDISIMYDLDKTQPVIATITDVDGPDNGGLFLTQDVTLVNESEVPVKMERSNP